MNRDDEGACTHERERHVVGERQHRTENEHRQDFLGPAESVFPDRTEVEGQQRVGEVVTGYVSLIDGRK
jgi:hypothetical protein